MFKVMMLLKRRSGLTLEQFIERYEGEHVPLVEQNVRSLRRYVRHYLHPASHVIATDDRVEEPDYDVITELWYDDRADYEAQERALRERPDVVAAVVVDELTLFDRSRSRTVFVEEHESQLRP